MAARFLHSWGWYFFSKVRKSPAAELIDNSLPHSNPLTMLTVTLSPPLSLLYTEGKSANLIISPYGYIYISTYLTYMFICAVFWCGLWLWPCLSGCPVLAESRYPHTCTHTHWHICIYIYIYKLNTHTAQGLGAVLASRFGRDHQLVCLVTVSNERRAGDECTPSTLFRYIFFNRSLNTY